MYESLCQREERGYSSGFNQIHKGGKQQAQGEGVWQLALGSPWPKVLFRP